MAVCRYELIIDGRSNFAEINNIKKAD